MRIVGGVARGRRLGAAPTSTRPTSDRAREAMFNSLASMMRLDGARVLDLFAGTGAVGLEALSRGAAAAVFVEKGRQALAALRRNIDTVGLNGATVVGRAVHQYLADPPDGAFDLVFADPPYALDTAKVQAVLAELETTGRLAPGAVLVVERSARDDPAQWGSAFVTPLAEKRYGDSLLWYGRAR